MHGLLAATAFSLLPLAVPSAVADEKEATILALNNPTVVVKSQGETYTALSMAESEDIEADVKIKFHAGVSGRVDFFSVWLALSHDYGPETQYKESAYSKAYYKPRPKGVDGTIFVEVPEQAYADYVIAGCNGLASLLESQGFSRKQIFEQDRKLSVSVFVRTDVRFTGIRGEGEVKEVTGANKHSVEVICQKAPSQPVDLVAGLTVKASKDVAVNSCSLTLNGVLGPKEGKGDTKDYLYRFVSQDGDTTKWAPVTANANGIAPVSAVYPLGANRKQKGSIRLEGKRANGKGQTAASAWMPYQGDCESSGPQVSIGTSPVKVQLLSVKAGQNTQYGALVCPSQATIRTRLEWSSKTWVTAVVRVNGTKQAEKTYNEDGNPIFVKDDAFDTSVPISWNAIGQTEAAASGAGGASSIPKQDLDIVVTLLGGGGQLITSLKRKETVKCKDPLALGVPINIVKPKGKVAEGSIVLTVPPGSANPKLNLFTLTFLRQKPGGGYQPFQTGGLPKTLVRQGANTVVTGKFKLALLQQGQNETQWRIKVCLAALPGACRTSDFTVPAIQNSSGRKPTQPNRFMAPGANSEQGGMPKAPQTMKFFRGKGQP